MHSWNGAGKMQKSVQQDDNMKDWTRVSLEENISVADDRTASRKRRCADGAANVRTDDADHSKESK